MPYPKEVWFVDQAASRSKSDPAVPPDESKAVRRYLVLATYNARRRTYVTMIPFQTPDPGVTHKVRVDATKTNGLDHDSWAVACEIVTVENQYINGPRLGILADDDYKRVMTAIMTYMRHVCPHPPVGANVSKP